ncbi:putative reverse transcriptase domain-containing protein [Tanacetum coccineum]
MSSSSSSSHATITYTSISIDMPSWAIPLMEAYESDSEAPKAAPQSPEQAPLLPILAPEYSEYLAPSDDDLPAEDQPLPADASPTALSPGYIADSKPIEDDFEEDPEEDSADYPSKKDKEEEPLAPDDSASPASNSVPSSKETKVFEEDETAATPPSSSSPHHIIPLFETRLCRARISIRPHTPPSPSTKERIAEYAAAPTPPSPPPSPFLPLSSPLPLIPSPPLALPSPNHIGAIPEADMPPWKRIYFTAPSHRFEIGESLAATAARQTVTALARGVDYGFIDTLDASIRATKERVMTALEEVNERMIDHATTHRHDKRGDIFTLCPFLLSERPIMLVRHGLIMRIRARLWRLRSEHYMLRFRELERIRDAELQDGPADAGSSCVADALADYEANRGSGNGHDSHHSGSGSGRTPNTARVCTYKDFLNCQPFNFKGTEGVVGLTQWFEKMESVFHISNCTVECQIKAYTDGPGEKKEYGGTLPLCTKCNYHHTGLCAAKCTNYKRIGHLDRDCRSPAAANNQRTLGAIQKVVTCFECEIQGHYKKDGLKLKNKNRRNQARNSEAHARAYSLGGNNENTYSNVVTGTFLLNNRYASILFDTGADRNFMSTAFSSLIDIIPSTLDNYYDVELADGKK